MRCYKVKIDKNSAYIIKESELEIVLSDLREMSSNQKMSILALEMSNEEYENLPEFDGF